MHELSIAQSILEIVRDHVPPAERPHVRTVRLRVGVMAGVVVDSLTFGFGSLVGGTDLSGASLAVETVPYVLRCADCGVLPGDEQGLALCPSCGSADTEIVSGTELSVVDVDLEP